MLLVSGNLVLGQLARIIALPLSRPVVATTLSAVALEACCVGPDAALDFRRCD
jgi:hypothetical protein